MSYFLNFNRTCSHVNRIDDIVNGFEVCTDCGLVMEQIFLPHEAYSISSKTSDHYVDKVNKKDILHISTFDNILQKCNIYDSNVEKKINKKFQSILKAYPKKNKHDETLIVLCVYLGLIEAEIPRPLKHLCQCTKVDEQSVWKHMKTFDCFFNPHLMVEYFLSPLDLSFKDLTKIKENVKLLERLITCSPRTIIAACAYTFLRKKEMNHLGKKIDVSISMISKKLNVSAMAISRCLKKLRNFENLIVDKQ